MTINEKALDLFLPDGTLKWFDIKDCIKERYDIRIILEEKNIPPITEELKNKKILSKGFYDITITDFPIRGKRALLTFRRRRWQVEGQKELLKRNIKLNFPGTQLAKEFADFLKDKSRNEPHVAQEYSQYV
jgi:hypothetical protein